MTKKNNLGLAEAFFEIQSLGAMRQFFDEIFTPAERKTFALRWELLKRLAEGKSQRSVASELGLSLCKITRGAKIIHDPGSVTRRILEQSQGTKEKRS